MNKIVLKSPAKVNLFLKVLGKRPDGYHRIEAVFERIDLCDRVILKKSKSGIELISDNKDLPTGEANLAYKAASLLLETAGSKEGVLIEIKKKIPISAGLGGGSSNASAVLRGLNSLYNFGLDREVILELARKLGADVAFFVHECSYAKGEWRGDIIHPIETDMRLWHVLVMPPFGLSTRDVYASVESYGEEKDADFDAVRTALETRDSTGLGGCLYNSLEKVVLARRPEIGRMKEEMLNLGAEAAVLSGSGPAIFCLAKTRKEALRIKGKLAKGMLAKKKDWLVYVVKTL